MNNEGLAVSVCLERSVGSIIYGDAYDLIVIRNSIKYVVAHNNNHSQQLLILQQHYNILAWKSSKIRMAESKLVILSYIKLSTRNNNSVRRKLVQVGYIEHCEPRFNYL